LTVGRWLSQDSAHRGWNACPHGNWTTLDSGSSSSKQMQHSIAWHSLAVQRVIVSMKPSGRRWSREAHDSSRVLSALVSQVSPAGPDERTSLTVFFRSSAITAARGLPTGTLFTAIMRSPEETFMDGFCAFQAPTTPCSSKSQTRRRPPAPCFRRMPKGPPETRVSSACTCTDFRLLRGKATLAVEDIQPILSLATNLTFTT